MKWLTDIDTISTSSQMTEKNKRMVRDFVFL